MAANLNDMIVKNLKPAEKEYTRREKGGFGVRVHPSGTKTFFYLYRVDGKRRFLNLGEYKDRQHPGGVTIEEARRVFGIERGKVAALKAGRSDGHDPVQVKKAAAEKRVSAAEDALRLPTIETLITDYIEKHAKPKKRGWAEDERILNKDALATWGQRKAQDITKRDVVLLLEKIIERGSPGSANNNFKIIRKMFNYAVEKDIIKTTPCAGVKMPAEEVRKDRYLTETEIRAFWTNIDTCLSSDEVKQALKLILVTGQRPGEVIGMHTTEINDKWWTIPAERSKNKREHHVYLTNTALDLIGSLEVLDPKTKELKQKGFIFRCPHIGKEKAIDNTAPAKVIRRNMAVPVLHEGKPVLDEKGKPVTENKIGVEKFTPHDLRRTAATFMSKIGFMDEIIDAVLNHTKQGIIRTYNVNRYDKEIQQALEAWERKLNSIIAGNESGKVIPIGSKNAA